MRIFQDMIPSKATTRSALLNEIRDVLKNRQHVEIYGKQIFIKKILDDLIVYEQGAAIIPPRHPEDFTIHLIPDIGFPSSDKITVEIAMRQVLQEFGWPPAREITLVKFYFTKLMKELYYDRILPVFLFEHPSVLKDKAYRVLEIISQHSVDRIAMGIPSIMCMHDSGDHQGSLSMTALPIYLHAIGGQRKFYVEAKKPSVSKRIIFNIVIAPNNVAFAISDSGVYELDSGECIWKEYSSGLFSNIWTDYYGKPYLFRTLSLCVDTSGTLYTGAFGSGVFKSVDKFNDQFKLFGLIKSSDLDFDTVFVKDTVCANIVLTNVGLAPFTLKKFNVIDPTPFSVDPQSASILPLILKPKDSVIMRICFHPPQHAVYASEIDWNTDIIDEPQCMGMKYQSFLRAVAIDGIIS